MSTDARLQRACTWASQILGHPVPDPQPVSGDASFRRYFRIAAATGTLILMDAPPDKEDSQPFVALARAWHAAGIPVPQVISWQANEGFMLLEDLGDTTLWQTVGTPDPGSEHITACSALYEQALDTLLHIQAVAAPAEHPLPDFDIARLGDEYALFTDWLMTRKLGMAPAGESARQLTAALSPLTTVFTSQPQVTVHRDYHSRNLMIRNDHLAVIDFQDAVRDPVTYDLVSLLRDCYITWPDEWVTHLADGFFDVLPRAHRPASRATFHRDLDFTGIQRHLKAAGIFARLALRDGKIRYLEDIPRTLSHLIRVGERHNELKALVQLVRDRVLPAVQETCLT